MAILDLRFNRKTKTSIEDYGTIISSVLNLKVPFTIVQYALSEQGIIMRISVPDEKLKEVMKILKENNIEIHNATIEINEDLCVNCGACISLCNTEALYFDEDFN